jgi:hypothetical protein
MVAGTLGSCATVMAEPTPSPALDREFKPLSVTETVAAMAECLSRKGWDIEPYRDGYAFPGPAEQADVFHEDNMACYRELGLDEAPPARMDDEHLAAKYAQEQQLRDCLIEQGYAPPELPSLQQYKDDILTKGVIYSSYEAIGIGMSDMSGIRDICVDPLEVWSG